MGFLSLRLRLHLLLFSTQPNPVASALQAIGMVENRVRSIYCAKKSSIKSKRRNGMDCKYGVKRTYSSTAILRYSFVVTTIFSRRVARVPLPDPVGGTRVARLERSQI